MLPLPITDIKANGIFKPDYIEFKNFSGMYAGQPVSMTGTFEPTKDGNDLTYAMTLSSSDVRIDDELLNLIPQRMRNTPEGATIGGIYRNGKLVFINSGTVIAAGDHVIMFLTDKRQISEVERLFQVRYSFV